MFISWQSSAWAETGNWRIDHLLAHSPASPGPTHSVASAKPSGREGASGRFSLVVLRLAGSTHRIATPQSHAQAQPQRRAACGVDATAPERYAPAQIVAALLGVLGARSQDAQPADAVCPHCGHVMPRDRNSALVVLIDAHAAQQIPFRDTPGTGVAARPKPRPRQRAKSKSLAHETPSTAPCIERRESSSSTPRSWYIDASQERGRPFVQRTASASAELIR